MRSIWVLADSFVGEVLQFFEPVDVGKKRAAKAAGLR